MAAVHRTARHHVPASVWERRLQRDAEELGKKGTNLWLRTTKGTYENTHKNLTCTALNPNTLKAVLGGQEELGFQNFVADFCCVIFVITAGVAGVQPRCSAVAVQLAGCRHLQQLQGPPCMRDTRVSCSSMSTDGSSGCRVSLLTQLRILLGKNIAMLRRSTRSTTLRTLFLFPIETPRHGMLSRIATPAPTVCARLV